MTQVSCNTQNNTPANSFADAFFRDPFFQVRPSVQKEFSPLVDIVNGENSATLYLDLPGVTKEDIHLEVENGVLTLKGERKGLELSDKDNYIHRSRRMGSFQKQYRLGDHLDGDSVQAQFENGVLKIEIKRKEQSLAKRIEIQ